MSKTNQFIFTILLSFSGIIVSFIGFLLLEKLLIPDGCKYHSEKPSWIINLLYDFPSSEGFHPFPSNFQFFLIVTIGIAISYFCVKKFISK